MRTIDKIIIHCSATPEDMDIGRDEIDRWHRERGWLGIGYHYVVRRDGTVEEGRPENQVGAHVYGHNKNSIGICMIGGIDADDHDKAEDNYTDAQWEALTPLVENLLGRYPDADVLGHNELAAKACPCFDVREWFAQAFEIGSEPKTFTSTAPAGTQRIVIQIDE